MRFMTLASSRYFAELVLVALALLLPAEAGTFKNPLLIDTTYDPIGVASGDFNRDGKPDLVYVDGMASSTLHLLLGNGDGTFSHGQDVSLPRGICSPFSFCFINVADVTADGNLDIVLGGDGTSVAQLAVLVGNGDGTFKAPLISILPNSSGGYPYLNGKMAIGDVNSDGVMDIVAADTMNGRLDILLGNNSGQFTLKSSQVLYFSGQTTLFVYDLNGDGHLDIVLNNSLGASTSVFLGNGNGTFQPANTVTSYAFLLADLDGDGHPDLVGVQYGQSVVVSKGNPDGTFASPTTVASVPANGNLSAVADYNGDGIPDLVFTTPTGVAVALGQGNLTYGVPISSVAGTSGIPFVTLPELAPGDFNGDGHNDLSMGVDGGVLILLGNGSGSFASADYYDVGHTVGVASVGDFNGDGIPDIAATVPATYPRLLLGTGSGTFSLAADQNHSYTSQTPAGALSVADFNGDGKPDLDFFDSSGQTFVWYNTGNSSFSSPLGVNAGSTLAADINKDGRSDLISVANLAITTMLGQSNSTFATVTTPLWYATQGIAAVGDLNNDGKPDLLAVEDPGLRIWLGNGDGTFSHSNLITFPQGFFGQSATIADLDGDGNADVVAFLPDPTPGARTGSLAVLFGNGDGTFQPPSFIPVSHLYSIISVADLNRDNRPDLVLSDGSGIALIYNLGNRTFSPEDRYVAGQGINQLNVVDVNGDGYPDIVAANYGGTTVTVLLNQPNGKPLDGASSVGVFTVTPTPSSYSQAVTLKIVLSAIAGAAAPTGAMTLYVDGTYITDVSLVSGIASYVYTPVLAPGVHTFVAAYNGDSTYSAESFSTLQTVKPPVYATRTALSVSPTSVFSSQTVSLTATVSASVAVPGGIVTFLDGSNSLGAQQIDPNGMAFLDTATLTPGSHQISAVYQGYQDPGNLHAVYQSSTSSPVNLTVNAVLTSTHISASTSSSVAGAVITFTAAVASATAAPFGGVSFYDNGALLGTVSLWAGTASFSTASLGTGSHSITAVFNANATFAASTSPALNINVTAAAAGLAPSLVMMNLRVGEGSAVLMAKVPGNSVPGTVIFLDSGKIIGTVSTDSSGQAAFPFSSLSSGIHNFSASFSGNGQFAPAVSPQFIEQWPSSGPGFSIDLSRESLTIGVAQSARLAISVTPAGNFRQPVQLACGAGLPAGHTCVFSPPSLTGGGISYLTLQKADKLRMNSRRGVPFYGVVLGLCALFLSCKQDRCRHCLLSLLIILDLSLIACGSSRSVFGRQRLQVISIQATSGSGSAVIIHSAQIIVGALPESQDH